MAADRPYEVQSLAWDAVELRVRDACSAGELAMALLPSKGVVSRVLARTQLRRGGRPLAREDRLEPSDVVTLAFARETGEAGTLASWPGGGPSRDGAAKVAPALDVLFCDPVMMVVDKPAGMLVHGDGTDAETLTDRVRSWLAREGHPGVRPQAIQRLDVDTTGLVLFSLTEEFQAALDAQVAGHAMGKRYLAVTRRTPAGAQRGWVELVGPIARDRHDAHRMRVGKSGKPACTRVRELAHAKGYCLLEVELITGRRHQIRVHLSHAGCPIVGDALYGGGRHAAGLMLHAWQERVVHPVTAEPLELGTAWPQRFGELFPEAL